MYLEEVLTLMAKEVSVQAWISTPHLSEKEIVNLSWSEIVPVIMILTFFLSMWLKMVQI